jgi:hypothetical protein
VHLRSRSHMAFLHIYGFMYLLFQYDIFVISYTFINVFSPQVSTLVLSVIWLSHFYIVSKMKVHRNMI